MKVAFLMLLWLIQHDVVVKQVACQSDTKVIDGISVTKWVCPLGITFVEPTN